MKPNTKITAAGVGGAVATIVVWIVGAITGAELPAPVAVAVGSLCSAGAGYLVKDSSTPAVVLPPVVPPTP